MLEERIFVWLGIVNHIQPRGYNMIRTKNIIDTIDNEKH
jgi:hypothetical protein